MADIVGAAFAFTTNDETVGLASPLNVAVTAPVASPRALPRVFIFGWGQVDTNVGITAMRVTIRDDGGGVKNDLNEDNVEAIEVDAGQTQPVMSMVVEDVGLSTGKAYALGIRGVIQGGTKLQASTLVLVLG